MKRLLGIVREIPNPEIEIIIDKDDIASISSGSSSFKINGLPTRDFPPLPSNEPKNRFSIEQGVLKEMLRKTSYAASMDETRRVLNGVFLSFKDGKLTMVATDGRRLALVEHAVDFPEGTVSEVILPSKAVNELLHILGDEGDAIILDQGNQIAFQFGDTTMNSRLIDGVYPNYRLVIPSGTEEHVVVERELRLAALRRVSLMTTDKSNSTRLTFGDNQLSIHTNTQEVGEAHEVIPIKYSGKVIDVTFNPEYMMDPLRNLENDEVFIDMTDGHSPALIKCDQPFLYVLMPLRTSN